MEQPDIQNPALWRLLVLFGRNTLSAVAISTVDDTQTAIVTVPCDSKSTAAVEEAVYSVPMLTADFSRVDVLVDTPHYLVAPAALTADERHAAAAYSCLSDDEEVLRSDAIAPLNASVEWSCNAAMADFLARTFRNPTVMCRVTPLLRYLGVRDAGGNSAKTYVHLGAGVVNTVDVVVIDRDGSLLACTTKDAPTAVDATYWAAAVMRQSGLDPAKDSVYLCGDPSLRMAALPMLRRVAANVLPLIYPSAALRGTHDMMKVPFPLILIPLCE